MKATAETIKWRPFRAFTSRPEAAFLVAVRLIRHQDPGEMSEPVGHGAGKALREGARVSVARSITALPPDVAISFGCSHMLIMGPKKVPQTVVSQPQVTTEECLMAERTMC
jgi:hypothetical protein